VTPPPPRNVQQVPRFRKAKRRLPGPFQDAVDDQVRLIMENPLLGEPKTGALKGVRVVKFRGGDHQYLLAYRFFPTSNVVEVLDVGVHENFYRDLAAHLQDRPRGECTQHFHTRWQPRLLHHSVTIMRENPGRKTMASLP